MSLVYLFGLMHFVFVNQDDLSHAFLLPRRWRYAPKRFVTAFKKKKKKRRPASAPLGHMTLFTGSTERQVRRFLMHVYMYFM